MQQQVIILRGPSGCGKSEHIKSNLSDAFVCSADNFFLEPDPDDTTKMVYAFDPSKLGAAHSNCLTDFVHAILVDKCPIIVVDNTHIQRWEWFNYYKIAASLDCKTEVREWRPVLIEHIKICIARNAHNTPREVIAKMCLDFEPYAGAISIPW